MNLHDVKPRPRITRVAFNDERQDEHRPTFAELTREMLRQPLMPYQRQFAERIVPLPDQDRLRFGLDPAAPDAEVTFRAAPEHEAIVERLHLQWLALQRANVHPHHFTKAAFVLTRREWHSLQVYLPWRDLETQFGVVMVTDPPTFRGYPLAIV